MESQTHITCSTGRARGVFVFGRSDSAKAVLGTVTAQALEASTGQRIVFCGSANFDRRVIEHIHTVILPMVDTFTETLGLVRSNYRVSITNPGGASIHNLGIEVSGYSADVPVFLAMLSAALKMPILETVVATGHLASGSGDIAAVQSLPAKLTAVLDGKTVNAFIYPDLKSDQSLGQLSPAEKERAEIAVINAKGKITLTAVSTIADLIGAVFTDHAIVLSSLEQGFFQTQPVRADNAIARSIHYLTERNEKRFWSVLEQLFQNGCCDQAKELLRTRLDYQTKRGLYPKQFGRMLLQLLRSLPPTTRKLTVDFPLFSVLDSVKLAQFAAESDSEDIRMLQDAAEGKHIALDRPIQTAPDLKTQTPSTSQDQIAVDQVIARIDAQGLSRTIGIPIDTARATWWLESLTVRSDEQFFDTIAAFYLHLKRHLNASAQLTDDATARADSVELVERAFARDGGLKTAMTEAAEAIHGGMKRVLDAMTEQFRTERQAAYVNQVIKQAISPLDVNAQLSFITVLLQRLAPHLPADVATASPDRFLEHYEDLIKEYVKSLDRINEVFRRY